MVWNSVVEEVRGDDKNGLTSVLTKSTLKDETRELQATGMFVAIGHTPNTAFLEGKLEMNDKGYIRLTKPFRTHTSVPGVFAAGDVSDDYYRQAITSAGTGCMAALDAERLLAQFEHH
jgi:thioredoxin reductase (NADPH)